eukprot:TRINITY_DN6861_c0_g1_i1.p1 TRINITY_DN6861_c0_g1~~TRINITY_DN6861_c0_g1_i1.p1  ORF type:complete len:800 (-),score=208.26 TRINITY_DN6861_c0_g1_i1:193-2592(-)
MADEIPAAGLDVAATTPPGVLGGRKFKGDREVVMSAQQANEVNKKMPRGVRYELIPVEPVATPEPIVSGRRARKPISFPDDDAAPVVTEVSGRRRKRSESPHSEAYTSPDDGYTPSFNERKPKKASKPKKGQSKLTDEQKKLKHREKLLAELAKVDRQLHTVNVDLHTAQPPVVYQQQPYVVPQPYYYQPVQPVRPVQKKRPAPAKPKSAPRRRQRSLSPEDELSSDDWSDNSSPHRSKRRRPVRLNDRMKGCLKILQQLMGHKYGHPFLQPVDPVKLQIPDYPNIITRPMDLGTVKDKLEHGEYRSSDEFVSDVRLVWSNCMTYNGAHTDVYFMAAQLSELFEKKLFDLPAAPPTPPVAVAQHTPDLSMAAPVAAAPLPSQEMMQVQQTVTALQRQIAELQREKEKPAPKPRAPRTREPSAPRPVSSTSGIKKPRKQKLDDDYLQSDDDEPDVDEDLILTKPMTFEEKRQLSLDINRLPQDKLPRVVQIITEAMPQAGNQEEIEIDIDALDTRTLRQLERFVRICLNRSAPKKRRNVSTPGVAGRSMQTPTSVQSITEIEARLREIAPKTKSLAVSQGGDEGLSLPSPAPTANTGISIDDYDEGSDDPDAQPVPAYAPPAVDEPAVPILPSSPAKKGVALANDSAWASLAATVDTTSAVAPASAADPLWNSFQKNSEQQRIREQQRAEQEEARRREREAAEAQRQLAAEQKKLAEQEEEQRRIAAAKDAELEEQRRREEERAAARAERERMTAEVGADNNTFFLTSAPALLNPRGSGAQIDAERLRALSASESGDSHA